MEGSDRDKGEGTVDDLKGRAKEGLGGLTGDEKTQAEGKGDQAKGHVKKATGNVKDAVDDLTR